MKASKEAFPRKRSTPFLHAFACRREWGLKREIGAGGLLRGDPRVRCASVAEALLLDDARAVGDFDGIGSAVLRDDAVGFGALLSFFGPKASGRLASLPAWGVSFPSFDALR